MTKNSNTTTSLLPEHTSLSQDSTSIHTSLMTGINELINTFKTQIMTMLQKQQEQINNLTQLFQKTEKKTDYVLNIIDSIYSNND